MTVPPPGAPTQNYPNGTPVLYDPSSPTGVYQGGSVDQSIPYYGTYGYPSGPYGTGPTGYPTTIPGYPGYPPSPGGGSGTIVNDPTMGGATNASGNGSGGLFGSATSAVNQALLYGLLGTGLAGNIANQQAYGSYEDVLSGMFSNYAQPFQTQLNTATGVGTDYASQFSATDSRIPFYSNLANTYANLTPTGVTSSIESMEQPLSSDLVNQVSNIVQGQVGARGLSGSPATFSTLMAQDLAPYVQQEQQLASQNYFNELGLPNQVPIPNIQSPLGNPALPPSVQPMANTDLSGLIQALMQGSGTGTGGSQGGAIQFAPVIDVNTNPSAVGGTGVGGSGYGSPGGSPNPPYPPNPPNPPNPPYNPNYPGFSNQLPLPPYSPNNPGVGYNPTENVGSGINYPSGYYDQNGNWVPLNPGEYGGGAYGAGGGPGNPTGYLGGYNPNYSYDGFAPGQGLGSTYNPANPIFGTTPGYPSGPSGDTGGDGIGAYDYNGYF